MSEAAAALEGAAGEQQQDQQQQQNAPAAWLEGLSDDLKSNADLVRMGSIEDLAKGYVETRAWAKGRVAIPSAEADDSAWQEFGAKLRPEKPEAYEIAVPEGQDTALAEQFRVFAYETGIPPRWVKAIAEFNNRAVADQVSAVVGRNQAEVESLQIELGPEAFEVRKQAVNAMFSAAGLGDGEGFEMVRALEQSQGSGAALKAMFALAEKTGELAKIDPVSVRLGLGSMSAAEARAEANRMVTTKDSQIAADLRDPNSAAAKRLKDLQARAARG